jgi:hypothetical protein
VRIAGCASTVRVQPVCHSSGNVLRRAVRLSISRCRSSRRGFKLITRTSSLPSDTLRRRPSTGPRHVGGCERARRRLRGRRQRRHTTDVTISVVPCLASAYGYLQTGASVCVRARGRVSLSDWRGRVHVRLRMRYAPGDRPSVRPSFRGEAIDKPGSARSTCGSHLGGKVGPHCIVLVPAPDVAGIAVSPSPRCPSRPIGGAAGEA